MGRAERCMSESCEIYEFGGFSLDPAHRALIGADGPVGLSTRAFDILALLVENRHRVVTKDEIMSRVWRGTIVEENNLAVQISALRRALGDKVEGAPLIMTVPGQGYRFVGRLKPPEMVPIAPLPPLPIDIDPLATDMSGTLPPPGTDPVPPRSARFRWLAGGGLGALLAATLGAAVLLSGHRPQPPASAPMVSPPRLSLAVLPFRNLGDDQHDNYLADAISDDLTTDLSHIPGSVVIARESSDMYRGRNLPTAQIGRELNVRYLLEGSLRREEDGFSINAQLFEAATGAHVWAKRFKVPRDHIAETQETIVRRLASALGVTLVDDAGQRSLAEHGENPDALDLFLRARSILDRSDTLDSMVEAQSLLEQAVALQPGYPDALSALSWLLLRKVYSSVDPQHDADLAEARRMVKLALAAAPNSAEALASQGLMLEADGHVPAAQASYEAALLLDSGSVEARTGLIHVLLRRGLFEEAVRRLNDLLLIDPEGPRNKVRYHDLGYAYLMLGRPDDALIWLGRGASGDPEQPDRPDELGRMEWSSLLRIAATDMVGDRGEARALYAQYARIWRHRSIWRLTSNVARAQSSRPGFRRFTDALKDAGMPEFGDETEIATADAAQSGAGAFDPLPAQAPGVTTIDTASVAATLAADPIVIDYGLGSARLHGAVMGSSGSHSLEDVLRLTRDRAVRRPVIVMGDGPYDRASYDAVLQLHRVGVAPLFWYRGGEEAWSRAGLPGEDARAP